MPRPILLLLGLTAVAAVAAVANPIVLPLVDGFDFAPGGEVSLVMAPDGSGTPFSAAWNAAGGQVDATLRIHLVDESGIPMSEVPVEDVWLMFDVPPGTATGCVQQQYYDGGVFLPDGESTPEGIMEWVLPLRGGGWSEGPASLYIYGIPAMDSDFVELPPFPIRANSPDIDGDLVVNLTDLGLFAQDLGGPYHYRSDLRWDGVINLSDIALFVRGLGATCR